MNMIKRDNSSNLMCIKSSLRCIYRHMMFCAYYRNEDTEIYYIPTLGDAFRTEYVATQSRWNLRKKITFTFFS